MITPFVLCSTEHIIFLSTLLFPPVLATVALIVILSTFGKSLGLRERYVSFLIRIFEWGAGEINETRVQRKRSRVFALGDDADENDENDDENDDDYPDEDDLSGGYDRTALMENHGAASSSGVYSSLDSMTHFRSGATTPLAVDDANSGIVAASHIAQRHYADGDASLSATGESVADCHLSCDSGIHTGGLFLSRSLSTNSPNLRRRNESSTSLTSLPSTRVRHSSGQSIIRRATAIHLDEDDVDSQDILSASTSVTSRGWQVVNDSLFFVKAGVEAIIEDEVTSRFQAEQLASWNMLTRTSISFYQFVNWKLSLLWVAGFMFRYTVLLPLRILLFALGISSLILTTAAIGVVPNGRLKRWLNEKCMLMCFRILARCISAVIYFHDEHNKARNGGICVANHTSPIDVLVLGTDNIYAMVGQRHSGVLGMLQRALNRASAHIWFERGEGRDRAHVARRLKEHVDDPNKLPILVFPEGTCINNTSVMMFKKGSFEVGAKIYPIAMKYDSRFGDPFWNSSTQSWLRYVFEMITSWAIICDVWYLPPMEKMNDETAIEFANRVKKTIAIRGGMVDLEWDGQLKRSKAPARLLEKQRKKYYHRYSRYTSECEPPSLEITGSDDGDTTLSDPLYNDVIADNDDAMMMDANGNSTMTLHDLDEEKAPTRKSSDNSLVYA